MLPRLMPYPRNTGCQISHLMRNELFERVPLHQPEDTSAIWREEGRRTHLFVHLIQQGKSLKENEKALSNRRGNEVWFLFRYGGRTGPLVYILFFFPKTISTIPSATSRCTIVQVNQCSFFLKGGHSKGISKPASCSISELPSPSP